jgi:uncharacterized sulfatase
MSCQFIRQTLVFVAVLVVFGGECVSAAEPQRPNIIFILADDLGWGDLGCYGQTKIRTPQLDRMAAEGMRFTQFYAGSTVCAPSRCTLMTGLHSGHSRVRGNQMANLRDEDVTVAELLRSAGYATGIIGKWGLGDEGNAGQPTRQGFDQFFGFLTQGHAHNYYPDYLFRGEAREQLPNEQAPAGPQAKRYGAGYAVKKVQYSHDRFVDEALTWIDEHKQGPFFLYLPLTIPHANNEARAATGDGQEVPDYGPYAEEPWPTPAKGQAAMISRMDADIGRLLDRLTALGIDRNTLVLFSSDNGPHKEGGFDLETFDPNGPLRGIKRDLYEGGIRVPFIAWWPGHIEPGLVTGHVGYFGDFFATAAELAGKPAPTALDSISFLPTLLGRPQDQQKHAALYWEFHEGGFHQAVRAGQWKGVRKGVKGPLELYDLTADRGEVHDVAAKHPDIVAKLTELLDTSRTPDEQWPVK